MLILRLAELVVVDPSPLLFGPSKLCPGMALISWIEEAIGLPPAIHRGDNTCTCMPPGMNAGPDPAILMHVEGLVHPVGDTTSSSRIVQLAVAKQKAAQ